MELLRKIRYKFITLVLAVILVITGGFVALKSSFVSEHPLVKLFAGSAPMVHVTPSQLHFYEQPGISLERIHIQAFFLTSTEHIGDIPATWKADITRALDAVKEFHLSQFSPSSEVSYSLLELPVIADGQIMNSIPVGIEHPTLTDLSPIDEFIDRNIIDPGSAFYRKSFAEVPEDAYVVKIIFIEGPAAVGTDGLVILSRNFISGTSLGYGTSILYHEFGHALGMPDHYDSGTGEAFSDDIMGSGRWRAINYAYIDNDIKDKMLKE